MEVEEVAAKGGDSTEEEDSGDENGDAKSRVDHASWHLHGVGAVSRGRS